MISMGLTNEEPTLLIKHYRFRLGGVQSGGVASIFLCLRVFFFYDEIVASVGEI